MADQTITVDNVAVEHGTARWGGPTATVTINAGPFAGRTFWLRSTQGLDSDVADLNRGGGIHLDASEPDGRRHDWRGAFKTHDMGEAIDGLIKYVNELAERQRVQDATWAETSALSEAWQAFTDSLEESSRLDFRAEWRRVLEAVAAIDMVIAEAGRG